MPASLRLSVRAALALSFALAACDDSSGPGSSTPQFSREITFEEFEEAVRSGEPLRVEIEILSVAEGPPYRASEVEIEEPEDLADREEVESRVVDIDATGNCEGTLHLEIEGVQVRFNEASTRFERDDSGDLTCTEFVDFINTELGAGRRPEIEAKREPSFQDGMPAPQAPDDPVFEATRIEVEDDDDDAELEINIDDENLVDCSVLSDPPSGCQGVLQVLNALIIIQEGVTELETEIGDERGETEFEGLVESVEIDPNDSRLGDVFLRDGRVIQVVEGTDVEQSGDDDHLRSLEEVDAALDAGFQVEAEGEGVVVSSAGPIVITAHEIEFEVEDED